MTHTIWRLYYACNYFVFILLAKAFFHFRVTGREHIPRRGGCILAPNHVSYADPPVIGIASNRPVCYVAKRELFKGLRGLWYWSIGAYPVDRGGADRAAYRHACRLLERGQAMVIFPEGTRSATGDLLPGQPGIARIARRCRVPIVPAWIEGTREVIPHDNRGIRFAPVTVRFGPPLSVEELEQFPDDKKGYQQTADEVMRRIAALRDQTALPSPEIDS